MGVPRGGQNVPYRLIAETDARSVAIAILLVTYILVRQHCRGTTFLTHPLLKNYLNYRLSDRKLKIA